MFFIAAGRPKNFDQSIMLADLPARGREYLKPCEISLRWQSDQGRRQVRCDPILLVLGQATTNHNGTVGVQLDCTIYLVNCMKKSLSYDTRLDEYGPFFKDNFAHEIFAIVQGRSPIDQFAFDLVAGWRAASYSAALPAAFPAVLESFFQGMQRSQPTNSMRQDFFHIVLSRLSKQIPTLNRNSKLTRNIQEVLKSLSQEVQQARKISNQMMTLKEDVWRGFQAEIAYMQGLHHALRFAFLSLIGNYETYLANLLNFVEQPEKPIRSNSKKFEQAFRKHFPSIADHAWFGQEMKKFRLIRHAIIHNGGRISSELESLSNVPARLEHGEIHVYPTHLRNAYQTLRKPAIDLTIAVVSNKP